MSKAKPSSELHRKLARVYHLHHRRADAELAPLGVTCGQPRILHHLDSRDGCIQRDLSEQCNLEPATVTNILALMERNGLIARERDAEDKRAYRVFRTEKGTEVHDRVESVFAKLEAECFRGFTAAEREQFFASLDRVYDNLKSASGRGPHA
jgi:DNA-binding MarR family transcriptional regulator